MKLLIGHLGSVHCFSPSLKSRPVPLTLTSLVVIFSYNFKVYRLVFFSFFLHIRVIKLFLVGLAILGF